MSATTKPNRNLLFLMLLVVLVLVFLQPLVTLLRYSSDHEHYSHIVLIPFVTAYLLYLNRRRLFSRPEFDLPGGAALVGAAALVYVVGTHWGSTWSENDRLSFQMLAFFILWVGVFRTCFGQQAFRAALFPVLFLVLVVPIPDLLLNSTIRFLQYQSADVSALLFSLSGAPVYRDGLIFQLPGQTILVSEECSGIRSSLALMITGLLAGHFFLRSRGARVLLALAVVPLAILKNGIRIVSLTLLSVYVDPGFLSGRLHRQGGFVFFGIALVVMAGVLWLLQKGERKILRPVPQTGDAD